MCTHTTHKTYEQFYKSDKHYALFPSQDNQTRKHYSYYFVLHVVKFELTVLNRTDKVVSTGSEEVTPIVEHVRILAHEFVNVFKLLLKYLNAYYLLKRFVWLSCHF